MFIPIVHVRFVRLCCNFIYIYFNFKIMAKLGTFYGLCPIIDHRSLLGITPDEEPGLVIVSLGKNIAIKYKLLDQKQVHSWRTKEKFTSPIIFDRSQGKYVAVFNQSYLRTWTGNEENLDKLKKIKFNEKIHTIFECNSKCLILFSNGTVASLSYALENRKSANPENVIDPDSQQIIDLVYAHQNEDIYIGLIVQKESSHSLYWTKFVENQLQQKFNTILLSRPDSDPSGYLIHVDKSSINFFSLWNDGRIFTTPLQEVDLQKTDPGELLTVIEAISCKDYVSMLPLDENYIALYGCNSNEEGALLVIYNVQFKVIQSRQPFKLFTNGAKLWSIDTNLFLPVGQDLAVVPFYLHTEQLAALVGSHKIIETDADDDISIVQKVEEVKWTETDPEQLENIPQALKPAIEGFLLQGLPENMIVSQILPNLLEKKNIGSISECLEYFCDLPEEWIARLLKFVLGLDAKSFKETTRITSEDFPEELQPLGRTALLNLILTKPFNESSLIPHLHRDFAISEAVLLLKYICFLLSENEYTLSNLNYVQSESRLIEWGMVLLDSNYQKFVLARDESINQVLINFNNMVERELNSITDLKKVLPLIIELNKRKSVYKLVASDIHYSIEELSLY